MVVFVVLAHTHHLAEGEERARIGIEHLVHVTRIIIPSPLERRDLSSQEPSDHGASPS
jgi:hypothetical protein